MARHTGGWIKLHRKIDKNAVFHDLPTLGIWTQLLLWAHSEDSATRLRGQVVTVKRGQVVTSSLELAQRFSVSRKLVDRCLKDLESTHSIRLKRNTRGCIITINKFGDYQSVEKKADNSGTAEVATAAHERHTEGRKREERSKNIIPPTPMTEFRMAKIATTKVVGAVRKKMSSDEAREHVGARHFDLLMLGYDGWEDFCRYYRTAYTKSSPTIVDAQLRETFLATLSTASEQDYQAAGG